MQSSGIVELDNNSRFFLGNYFRTDSKRDTFVRRLRRLGFEGPYAGGRHHFMVFEQHRLAIPSNSEYSVPQLRLLLREVAGILGREVMLDEWNRLR